jgi:hypothetical protein
LIFDPSMRGGAPVDAGHDEPETREESPAAFVMTAMHAPVLPPLLVRKRDEPR